MEATGMFQTVQFAQQVSISQTIYEQLFTTKKFAHKFCAYILKCKIIWRGTCLGLKNVVK